MQKVTIIAFIIFVVTIAHGHGQTLSVSVIPTRSHFTSTEKVQVTLKYKNNGPNTVLLYTWALPTGILQQQLFTVTRNGESAQYLGLLVKRPPPTAKDTTPLPAGKEISVVIDLAQSYDMPETDSYAVQFETTANLLVHTSASEKTSSSGADELLLQSEPITLSIEGRPNALADENAKAGAETKSSKISYLSCSTSRQTAIAAGVKAAGTYASSSASYLAKLTSAASKRYTTWFGKYSSSNLATVKTHFKNINTTVYTKSITFSCACEVSGAYAYVYANAPYTVYLCSYFFSAPVTGTDSKAGTIIHELSHFTVVAGTQDNGYGQSTCKALAISSPTKAINNADSHEYFAENNPALT